MSNRAKYGMQAAVLAGAGALGWAVLEPFRYTVRFFEVPILPAGQRDIRLLHISDLHLKPGQRSKIKWLRSLIELEPDVVINTGDNWAMPGSLETALEALEPLFSRPGGFVFGSNDYYAARPKNPARYLLERFSGNMGHLSASEEAELEENHLPSAELGVAFKAAGWVDLNNQAQLIMVNGRVNGTHNGAGGGQAGNRGGVVISALGVDDPHLGRDELPAEFLPAPVVTAASDEAGATDSEAQLAPAAEPVPVPVVNIGVTHAPYRRVLDGMTRRGAQLILAGHTHGGQLCVPGYGALVTNCDLPLSMAKGLHKWQVVADSARTEVHYVASGQPGGGNRGWHEVSYGGVDAGGDPAGRQGQDLRNAKLVARGLGGGKFQANNVEPSAYLHVSAGLGVSPFAPVRFACRPEVSLIKLVAAPDSGR